MSQSFGHIKIPNVGTGYNDQAHLTDKRMRYRGIFINLLAQQMVTDVIKSMRGCSQCPPTELNNMVVDIIGTVAARS